MIIILIVYLAGAVGAFSIAADEYETARGAAHLALLWPLMLIAALCGLIGRNLLR